MATAHSPGHLWKTCIRAADLARGSPYFLSVCVHCPALIAYCPLAVLYQSRATGPVFDLGHRESYPVLIHTEPDPEFRRALPQFVGIRLPADYLSLVGVK